MSTRRSMQVPAQAYDICIGDADGLCSVLQWRLHAPKATQLLAAPRCSAQDMRNFQFSPGDEILVCNLPIKAQPSVEALVPAQRTIVEYLDCRAYGTNVRPLRGNAAESAFTRGCTSLLVDHLLGGKFRGWALVGAYGSQLKRWADVHAGRLGLAEAQRSRLQRLGEVITYNAEVTHARHLYLEPAHLYAQLARYLDPMDFLREETLAQDLDGVRQSDLRKAMALRPYWSDAHASVYVMPDEDWACRVAKLFKLQLTEWDPHRVFAVLSPAGTGTVRVAVQAGLTACKDRKPRKWLIERLPLAEVDHFVAAFSASGWGCLRSPVFRAWS